MPLQDKNTEVVVGALTAAKAADIGNVVRSLDADTLDVLMKYLYAGMASPEKYNAANLLSWHEEVCAQCVASARNACWK